MMYQNDHRAVLTLDAGGSNFAFSAVQGNREVIPAFTLTAATDDLEKCLDTLLYGFSRSITLLSDKGYGRPAAISFAFPGPADYKHGIIGELPNFPAFRGGVPLGPYLQQYFKLPVFINNDGNLFAYGEALAGALPFVNQALREKGCIRQYSNLIGITLGTGFGSGVVINNILLEGDNGCGGDIWMFRNKLYPELISEESVSIRGVLREYERLSGFSAKTLCPEDIFKIAEGRQSGDRAAAIRSFELLGEVAADSIAYMLSVVDGLVVLGGGLMGAQRYIVPAMMKELRSSLSTFSGGSFKRLEMEVFDLTDAGDSSEFYRNRSESDVVWDGRMKTLDQSPIQYDKSKQAGIIVSSLGTNRAISIGAYNYALHMLDHSV